MWGATNDIRSPDAPQVFQSTRPVWGATSDRFSRSNSFTFQSTRPVWGATNTFLKKYTKSIHFNPRAPCGARLIGRAHRLLNKLFQSTRPVWGATTHVVPSSSSPHNFNPRAPCGARLLVTPQKAVKALISIHAPRVGRDGHGSSRHCEMSQFQSTRPVWGATANLTILPRQICTKGTKEFLLGRKTHGKKGKIK